MTLTQIKQTLNTVAFNFSYTKDEAGAQTKFLRHWEPKQRYALVAHEDVIARIKADPNLDKLAMKWQSKETQERKDAAGNVTNADTAGLVYDSYILIIADSIAASL